MEETLQEKPAKRKRPYATADEAETFRPYHLPPDSINPFSRSPAQLLQFAIAGLTDTDEDPSLRIPGFPHRGLDYGVLGWGVEPESEGQEEDARQSNADTPRSISHRERQLVVLLHSIHHFLDQGDITKAARAYGFVLQLQPHGKPINIRHHNLWAIGAEILMREGESPVKETSAETSTDPSSRNSACYRRWGSAANMTKLKAYFETIIQQYPYDYRRPRKISALDFWSAMLSCEIYNTYAEHVLALNGLERDVPHWDDDIGGATGDEDESTDTDDGEDRGRKTQLKKRKDKLRTDALVSMRDISHRMDDIMQNQPYSKDPSFLKLRATASLYIADLVLPIAPTSSLETRGAREERQWEQVRARDSLVKVMELGGELDQAALDLLGLNREAETSPVPPMYYSSLPIREG